MVTAKDILEAIETGQMIAYYQPQYDALTGKLKSAEALARWTKADGSMVMPGDFIPVAEESDVVNAIDWRILECVCQMMQKRLTVGEKCVPVAVNFSRRHFVEADYLEHLLNTVDRYQVPHNLIEVEITESALAANADIDLAGWVQAIRDAGFSVAIDDFGSGLSSLSMVMEISANVLKIDRSLINHKLQNDKTRILLESIFSFANRMQLVTVAEGVETQEEVGFLRTCDCSLIQGYLYAKPMSEKDFEAVLTARKRAEEEIVDILQIQSPSGAMNLLMEAIFMKYPLVIMSNLTRNSFFMMVYDNFTTTSCPASGVFDELIAHGAATMQEGDQELFASTFSRTHLLEANAAGEKYVRAVTRQLGDDGVYRPVETVDYFVKNPNSSDVLVITLCQTLSE